LKECEHSVSRLTEWHTYHTLLKWWVSCECSDDLPSAELVPEANIVQARSVIGKV